MSKGISGLFSGTKGEKSTRDNNIDFLVNTSIVWEHLTATSDNYTDTVVPRSFNIDTPQGEMWTHGNATEHILEAVTSTKSTSHIIINSNPKLYSQLILFDYWQSLSQAVASGIQYETLISVGSWEFKFARPRNDGKNPVVKHAKFNGI